MSMYDEIEDSQSGAGPEIHRCPEKRTCSKSYACYPAHHCDLDEGHEGHHVCDCGKTFRQGNEL